MQNEEEVKNAVALLVREDIANWEVLRAISFSLSAAGLERVDVLNFFAGIMVVNAAELQEDQIDLLGDICAHLVGQCNVASIIRLAGDPEDNEALMQRVRSAAKSWRSPFQKP